MSEDFVKVANTNDIQPSHMKEVQLDGENICLVNVEGKWLKNLRVTDDWCLNE